VVRWVSRHFAWFQRAICTLASRQPSTDDFSTLQSLLAKITTFRVSAPVLLSNGHQKWLHPVLWLGQLPARHLKETPSLRLSSQETWVLSSLALLAFAQVLNSLDRVSRRVVERSRWSLATSHGTRPWGKRSPGFPLTKRYDSEQVFGTSLGIGLSPRRARPRERLNR